MTSSATIQSLSHEDIYRNNIDDFSMGLPSLSSLLDLIACTYDKQDTSTCPSTGISGQAPSDSPSIVWLSTEPFNSLDQDPLINAEIEFSTDNESLCNEEEEEVYGNSVYKNYKINDQEKGDEGKTGNTDDTSYLEDKNYRDCEYASDDQNSDDDTELSEKSPSSPTESQLEIKEDDIQPFDILSGRGGKVNNHEGNCVFRQVVESMKPTYRAMEDKALKAAIPNAIVQFLQIKYNARFFKKSSTKSAYVNMSFKESRDKVAQALREQKKNSTGKARYKMKSKKK